MNDSLFNYPKFYRFAANHVHYSTFVEVGVQKGGSIVFLAKRLKERGSPFTLYAVDLWERLGETGCPPESVENFRPVFEARIVNEGVSDCIKALQMASTDAAAIFENESLDFVFLDASHTLIAVKSDITAWLPKIKSGGMISGHDYGEPCGVKQAVDEAFTTSINLMGTCWYKTL